MDMDTIVGKWFSTRDQKITWSISLAFLIIFPIYFANISTFLPDDAMISNGGGMTGKWTVTLDETVEISDSEEIDMDHEEIYELEFSYDNLAPNLAYIEITVSHDESGESGPGPAPAAFPEECDTVDVALDMGDVNGYIMEGSTTESTSGTGNCPSVQVLRILMIENYSSEGGDSEGTKSEILAGYDDNGQGRGDWAGDITLTVNRGGVAGGPTQNRDQGETVTIEWKVVSVAVEVTPVVDVSL
jgi:hypothetical protein